MRLIRELRNEIDRLRQLLVTTHMVTLEAQRMGFFSFFMDRITKSVAGLGW